MGFGGGGEAATAGEGWHPWRSRCSTRICGAMAGSVKSKILIIGGTGYIGRFIVEASAISGHPTFALVRESSAGDPEKAKILDRFKSSGVTLLSGDMHDHESLVKAVKQVDVVISAVGVSQLEDQVKIIDAIKEAGNVKRFLPSEFGVDVDRTHFVEPAKSMFVVKVQKIRRAIEDLGIPYTYISSHYFAGYFLPALAQAVTTGPHSGKVVIFGNGKNKAIFVDEKDIGAYTIKAVEDPRTLNKTLYLMPPANIYSNDELISLWEKKTGKTQERVYLSEQEVLKKIEEAPFPINITLAIMKVDTTNFKIEPSFGVEASELYPDVNYTTVDEYLSRFA